MGRQRLRRSIDQLKFRQRQSRSAASDYAKLGRERRVIDKNRSANGASIFFAQKSHAQRTEGWWRFALVGPDITFTHQIAGKSQRWGGERSGAGGRALKVGILGVSLGRIEDARGIGLRGAPLRGDRRGAGVNTIIIDVGAGRTDRGSPAAEREHGSLHVTCTVGEQSARDVHRRAAAHDDRVACGKRYRAPARGELGDVAFDDGKIAGEIPERRADPGTSVVDTRLAQIDDQWDTADPGITLQGRIRQLRAAHLHHEEVLGQRNEAIDRSADIDDRTFVEVNLSAIKKELLASGDKILPQILLAVDERPLASPHRDIARGGGENRTPPEINSLAVDVDFGVLRQPCSGKLLAVRIGEDRGQAPRRHFDQTRKLREKGNIGFGLSNVVKLGVTHCPVAGQEIDAAVEVDRCCAG